MKRTFEIRYSLFYILRFKRVLCKPNTYTAMCLARIFHELLPRDRGEGGATGKPQGVGPESYLNSTSQGPTPEDTWKDGHIRGRSPP